MFYIIGAILLFIAMLFGFYVVLRVDKKIQQQRKINIVDLPPL